MSPRENIEAAMPCRAAERSSSTASLPLRGAPLPSRSSRARLCLAIGRLASTALRYHSMALVESRSTTKPRSYITPTLKADCAEPRWAARSSQPAAACWSLATPMPCTRRRASSSMAVTSSAFARLRTSSIGSAGQSTEDASLSLASDTAVVMDGAFAWPKSALVTSGGEVDSGTAIVADGAVVLAASDSRSGDAVGGDSISHTAVAPAAATTSAAPTVKPGRIMEKAGRKSRSSPNNSRHRAGPRRCRAMPHDDHKGQQYYRSGLVQCRDGDLDSRQEC